MKYRKSQSKKAEALTLLLPAKEGWALWEFTIKQTQLKQNIGSLTEIASLGKIIFAFPLRHVFCLPLWLSTEDKTLLPDLIFTQLERRGLLIRSREETVMNYHVIKVEEGKTLVTTLILPSQLPEAFLREPAQSYDISARFYPLPENQIILWHELGQLVVAFTHEKTLVHSQSLSASEINSATLQELFCLYLELESEQVIRGIQGITLWGNFSSQEAQQIQATFQVNPQLSELPSPCLPATLFSLTPYPIQQTKLHHEKEERNKKIILGVLAGYGVLLMLWISQLLFYYGQAYWIRRDVKKNTALVQSLKETASRWNSLGTALQPDRYALEILYQCASLLPQEGVRFTLFEATDTGVVLRGEASSVAAASSFYEKLQQNNQLIGYQWEMPPPAILPNDTAQFQITGSRFDAPTQPQ